MSGASMSSVGNRAVYEADDQRTVPDSEKNKAERFKEGKKHSHQPNDSSTFTSAHKSPYLWSSGIED
jgi:hypothetical protein